MFAEFIYSMCLLVSLGDLRESKVIMFLVLCVALSHKPYMIMFPNFIDIFFYGDTFTFRMPTPS